MIETSTRYVPHIVALLALAAIPTVLHSLGRLNVKDCADPATLLATPRGAAAPILSAAERRRFDSDWGPGNWSAGTLPDVEGGARLHYVVARSYDPKAVYHWPEGRVFDETRPIERRLEEVDAQGERIPVHHPIFGRDGEPSSSMLAAYLLVYEGQAVANPYLAQVLAGPRQVVMGRRPMWLFLVYGTVEAPERPDAEARAREWLAAAWQRHRAVCSSEGRPL